MCPGFTSPGGSMPIFIDAEEPVVCIWYIM